MYTIRKKKTTQINSIFYLREWYPIRFGSSRSAKHTKVLDKCKEKIIELNELDDGCEYIIVEKIKTGYGKFYHKIVE